MKYLATVLLLTCSILGFSQADTRFLVAPYLQFATKNSIYVLWETRQPATSLVIYGEARSHVSKVVLDKKVAMAGSRTMHELQLPDLKPETNYFWQAISVQGTDTLKTEVFTFKTAVQDNSAYMFALVGDTQRNDKTPWAWGKIADLVWEDRPNFVVHAGDIVDQGLDKNDWLDNYFPNGRPLIHRVPVYTVLGNHEQDAPYYYQYMVAPAPEYWYTFTYGNAQFFMIDTNRDVSEGSDQYNWLEWELAKSTATWKIAIHHHPPYSSDSDDHGNTSRELSTLGTHARNLVPLYEKYGLDFCLFGHTHLYERTWPIREDRINMKSGVVYINSGGAGGNLENFAPTRSWFTSELQIVHHYCTFNIFENNVAFKAIDHEGRMIDAFQLTKPMADAKAAVLQPPVPKLNAEKVLFEGSTSLTMEPAFDNLTIHYTIDGSEPSLNSPLYKQPLTINETKLVLARAYTKEGHASRIARLQLRKMAPMAGLKVKSERGIKATYYEGKWDRLPDFTKLKPVKSLIVPTMGLKEISPREDEFGIVYEGYVEIKSPGIQTFFLNTDDGSRMYINDQLIIDHDGDHGAIKKTGQIILGAGLHKVRVEYFEASGGQFIEAGLVSENLGAVPFAAFSLSHQK